MKVGLNSGLNCQPMRFKKNERSEQEFVNNSASFKSVNAAQSNMSINEKYELAKRIIAAQGQIIESLQKQSLSGLPASNLLNRFA